MALTLDDVQRIAHLARIELGGSEADEALARLTSIFDLIATMQAVDTSEVDAMSHALDMGLRLRPDEVTETDQRELLLSLAPQTGSGLYLVPRVIE